MKKLFVFMFVFSLVLTGFVLAQQDGDFEICIDLIAPEAPTGLSITGNVQLSWNEAEDFPECSGIDHYEVYRDNVLVGTVGSTSFSDISLADGTYEYGVIAVDLAGNNGALAEGSITLGSDDSPGGGGGPSGGSSGSSSGEATTEDGVSGSTGGDIEELETETTGDTNAPEELANNGGLFSRITGAVIGPNGRPNILGILVFLVIIIAVYFVSAGVRKKIKLKSTSSVPHTN